MLLDAPQAVKNFTLTNTEGERVELAALRGKYVLLFFGYSYCPDVCPTTLADLSRAVKVLGKDAEQVQVLMITVDPERDTPERLGHYLSAFNPSFMGLTGTPEEISAVATGFGIFHEKHEGSAATGYLVDHTATVSVIDPDGYLRMLFSFDASGEEIAADLQTLLK
jgi:protein SCO1/2